LQLAEKAQSLNPGELTVLDTLGWVHFRKGDYKKAVELIAKVQQGSPASPIVNYHLGMAQYKSGNRALARESLKKSIGGNERFIGREEAEKTLKTL